MSLCFIPLILLSILLCTLFYNELLIRSKRICALAATPCETLEFSKLEPWVTPELFTTLSDLYTECKIRRSDMQEWCEDHDLSQPPFRQLQRRRDRHYSNRK